MQQKIEKFLQSTALSLDMALVRDILECVQIPYDNETSSSARQSYTMSSVFSEEAHSVRVGDLVNDDGVFFALIRVNGGSHGDIPCTLLAQFLHGDDGKDLLVRVTLCKIRRDNGDLINSKLLD